MYCADTDGKPGRTLNPPLLDPPPVAPPASQGAALPATEVSPAPAASDAAESAPASPAAGGQGAP